MCTRQVLYHLTRPPAITVKDYFKPLSKNVRQAVWKKGNNLYLIVFFFHIPLHGLLEGKYPHSDCVVNFHSSGRQWERMLNHTHCWSVIQHLFNPTDYKEFLNGLFFLINPQILSCVINAILCAFYTLVNFATASKFHRISDPFISLSELASQWKWEVVGVDLLSWYLGSLSTNNKPHGLVAGVGLKLFSNTSSVLSSQVNCLKIYLFIYLAHVKMSPQVFIPLACQLQNAFTVLPAFWTFSFFLLREKTEITSWKNHTGGCCL